MDVTTCSDAWRLGKDNTGLSDHRRIHFQLNDGVEGADTQLRTTKCFNTKKANWSIFNEVLCARLVEESLTEETVKAIASEGELENVVVKLTEVTREACRAAAPAIATGGRARKIVWWTEELSEMRSTVRTLRRRIAGAHPGWKKQTYEEYSAAKETY